MKLKRQNKFNAKKVELDGILFDSHMEARRYKELRLLEKGDQIIKLRIHPRFPIRIGHKVVCHTELDFCYYDILKRKVIYEDVKGLYTPMSKLKHKLFETYYNEKVSIVRA